MTTMEGVLSKYARREVEREASVNPLADGVAWVEGQLTPIFEARIPILDEGFLHSDLTYDVLHVWDGRFFRSEDHLDRIDRGIKKLRLNWPVPRNEVKDIMIDMVQRSGIKDAFLKLIVTRGLKGVRGSKSKDISNRLYILLTPYSWIMKPEMQLDGSGSAIVTRTVHRTSPGCMDPTVKNLQWGDLVKAMFEAEDRHAAFPFLGDGDNNLTEGSGFNIVVVKDGELFTPMRGVLEGITRLTVIDVCKILGLNIKVDFVAVEMLYESDEVFMTSTGGGVMPVTTIDGGPVGNGKIGPITSKIWDLYWKLHYSDEYSFPIEYN